MKKILAIILLFIISFSQVLACWLGDVYYSEDICEEFSWDETKSYNVIFEEYRFKVRKILLERIDLTQKKDYESFLVLEQKVRDYIIFR